MRGICGCDALNVFCQCDHRCPPVPVIDPIKALEETEAQAWARYNAEEARQAYVPPARWPLAHCAHENTEEITVRAFDGALALSHITCTDCNTTL